MKKILILTNYYLGLKAFRKELLEKFKELGHEVYVSLPFEPDMSELKPFVNKFFDAPLNRRGVNPIEDIKLYNHYIKILKEVKPDIVLTYTIKSNIYGGLACQKLNIPYYTTITGLGSAFQKENLQKKFIVFLYRLGLKKVKKVFFQNETNKNIIISNKITSEEKSILVPGSGVNTEHFVYMDYPEDFDKLNFLFIGRIMKEKGVDELLYCIEKLNEKYNNLSFSFVGNYEDNYKDKIEDFQNRKLIDYYGYQIDVRSFIEKANCIVIPSYHEGLCNVLLEASACGRPVIATDIPGCRETLIDEETGLLCKVKDTKSLYNSCIKFINLSYEEKKQMGINAREFVKNNFDRKTVVKEYIKTIQ